MSGLTRKPRVGDRLTYVPHFKNSPTEFVVTRLVGNICHTLDSRGNESSFIWQFHDIGLNTQFTIVQEGAEDAT